MPFKDGARQRGCIAAWRVANAAHIRRATGRYYLDNRNRILSRRDELRSERERDRRADLEILRGNEGATPEVLQYHSDAGRRLGSRPTPRDSIKRGEVRWIERAKRAATYERKRRGRPKLYPGNAR